MHYLVAERAGRLLEAPGSFQHEHDGHWSDYRALHQPGDEIRLSNSNKDYLGVLRLIAPDASRLDARLATALADLRWVLA